MAMTPEDMTHLNFMKKQQWNVAYYALLLLAAVFAVKQAFKPLVDDERRLLTVLCVLVLVLGIILLSFIQCDIGKLRKRIGLDPDAYVRGVEFTLVLGLTMFLACGTVVYDLVALNSWDLSREGKSLRLNGWQRIGIVLPGLIWRAAAFSAGGDGDGNPLDGRIRQEVAARMIFGPRGGRLRAKDAALTFRQWCSSGTLARDCSEFEL